MEKTVKTRRSYHCVFEGTTLKERILYMIEQYDSDEKLLLSEEFDEEGEVIISNTYQYENGVLVLQKTKQLFGEYYKESKLEGIYKNGLLAKEIEWFEDESFIASINSYDAEKRIISTIKVDDQNISHGTIKYFYPDGNTVLEEHYDEDEELEHSTTITKDAEGREIKNVVRIPDASVTTTDTTYFEEEAVLERHTYWDDRLVESINQIYDAEGELVKCIIKDLEEDTVIEHHFQNNSKNEMVREEIYKNGQLEEVEEYVYDENGETIESRFTKQTWRDVYTVDVAQYDIEYY